MVKLSIIVPVYNVENELACCLDSILAQTFKNFEVICVNDGSTDESVQILEKYALFDDRIKIVTKENAGLSSARNAGIEAAQGEYIGFVDSDDWVSPLMFEKLYNNAKTRESDITYCNVVWFNSNTRKFFAVQNGVTDILEKNFSNTGFYDDQINPALFFEIPCSAWNKIYRTEFLKSNNIIFKEGYVFEDVPFYTETFLKAKKISFDKNRYYIYRANREGSIIQVGGRKYFDAFPIFDMTREIFHSQGKWEKYKTLWFLYEIKTLFIDLYKIGPDLQEEYFYAIKKRFENEDLSVYDIEFLKKIEIFAYFIELMKTDFETFKPLLQNLEKVL